MLKSKNRYLKYIVLKYEESQLLIIYTRQILSFLKLQYNSEFRVLQGLLLCCDSFKIERLKNRALVSVLSNFSSLI